MNPLYRVWWRFLMDLRPSVRYFAERLPKLAPWAVRLRIVLHAIIGNPVHSLAVVDGLLLWLGHGWPWRPVLVGVVAVFVLMEIYHRLGFKAGGGLIGWREAWRLRRRWPSDWATVAAKTARVQAEVGTSKEPIASAVLRPVADHPKMSWLPKIDWPVVSWWVGPPPGRSLAALDELAVVLAANISHVVDVKVEYERENDSHGRLIMSFDDVLAAPSTPTWASTATSKHTATGPTLVEELPDVLSDAISAFDDEQPVVCPPLRVIDGEASDAS